MQFATMQTSVWYGCVLRGDLNNIKVGAFSNIQDRTVIHAARSSSPSSNLQNEFTHISEDLSICENVHRQTDTIAFFQHSCDLRNDPRCIESRPELVAP